jgi:hypothetical protein
MNWAGLAESMFGNVSKRKSGGSMGQAAQQAYQQGAATPFSGASPFPQVTGTLQSGPAPTGQPNLSYNPQPPQTPKLPMSGGIDILRQLLSGSKSTMGSPVDTQSPIFKALLDRLMNRQSQGGYGDWVNHERTMK